MHKTGGIALPPIRWRIPATVWCRRLSARRGLASAAALSFTLALSACTGATLDTTNIDTLKRSFDEIVEGMPEKERVALANAILTIRADSENETVLPRHLPKKRDVEAMFHPMFQHDYFQMVVASASGRIHGKTVAELLAMAEEVSGEAARNHTAAQRARIEGEISNLRKSLPTLRANVETAAATLAEARPDIQEDLSVLDNLIVAVDRQEPRLERGWLKNRVDLTYTNRTDHLVHDVSFGFDWQYDECKGYRYNRPNLRILKSSLEPGASISVVGQAGLGWFRKNGQVSDDDTGRECSISTSDRYDVIGARASWIRLGEPARTLGRANIQRELSRLKDAVEASEKRLSNQLALIEEKETSLAAVQ